MPAVTKEELISPVHIGLAVISLYVAHYSTECFILSAVLNRKIVKQTRWAQYLTESCMLGSVLYRKLYFRLSV